MKITEERSDNTRVAKPVTQTFIKSTPRQYSFIDLGGTPNDETLDQRNYWNPIKGAKERFRSSMRNETNPLIGLERTVMPAMAGAALVTTPVALIGGVLGSEAVNKMTGGWGNWLEGKTGIPAELGEYLNPGAIYGGAKGYKIDSNKLASKFIKGDAELGWNTLNKNHWIFNKEARNPTNIAMATVNRVMPFLSNIEKTPARIAAYATGKRTKGNASVSMSDIKSNKSTYTGAATPEGNNGDRNLLGLYLFNNDPIVSKTPWFNKVTESFKPARGKGFSYNQRYSELYPGIEGRRYQMQSVVKDSRPLKFSNINEFNEYSNGIGKLQGKEGDMVIDMGDGFQNFRQPGTNYAGPIDDVGGHIVKIDYSNKGKLTQVSQDLWKFNPADYAKRWSGTSKSEGVRATKQAALMDKVGTPFILQQENPIVIGRNRVWESLEQIPEILKSRRQPLMQGSLLTMRSGGTFKKSPLLKNAEKLNGKRDLRKKIVKSSRPTYSNNRIRKGENGLQFVSYEPIESITPNISKLPTGIFSSYNIPSNTTSPITTSNTESPISWSAPTIFNKHITEPTKFNGNKDFISKMRPIFKDALTKNGLDPKYTDYLVAQSALESGWGKSQSGKFNLGGIKGKGTVRKTREVIDGKDIYINDSFRDFDSLEDYANYHVNLLNNKRYKAFSNNDFIGSVVKGGYATDPKYKDILTNWYKQVTSS